MKKICGSVIPIPKEKLREGIIAVADKRSFDEKYGKNFKFPDQASTLEEQDSLDLSDIIPLFESIMKRNEKVQSLRESAKTPAQKLRESDMLAFAPSPQAEPINGNHENDNHDADFKAEGTYTISNTGRIEVQMNRSGSVKYRFVYDGVPDKVETAPIKWGYFDEDGNGPFDTPDEAGISEEKSEDAEAVPYFKIGKDGMTVCLDEVMLLR